MKQALKILMTFVISFTAYSETINVNKLEEACDKGDGNACFTLGRRFYKGEGVKKDDVRSLRLFEKGCVESGNASSCTNAGGFYEFGIGTSINYTVAAKRYKIACDKSSKGACLNLAMFYAKGKGVEQNDKKAVNLTNKSCDLGDSLACYNLGQMYDRGLKVEEDKSKAIHFYKKSCRDNHPSACLNLGLMTFKGEGVEQDVKKAYELISKACKGGHKKACNISAEIKRKVKIK